MKFKLGMLTLVVLLMAVLPSAALAQGPGGGEIYQVYNANVTPALEAWLAANGWVLIKSEFVTDLSRSYPVLLNTYAKLGSTAANGAPWGTSAGVKGGSLGVVVPGPANVYECRRIYGWCGTYNYQTGQCYCAW